MDISETTPVSMSHLNDECLRAIFLHLPVLDRIKMRIVCRQWCDVSSDCWRDIKDITIRFEKNDVIIDTSTDRIRSSNLKFLTKFVKQCAPHLQHLKLRFPLDEDSPHILRKAALKSSRNIKILNVHISTPHEADIVSNLLITNKEIKVLGIFMLGPYDCLKNLSSRYLEDLHIMWHDKAGTCEDLKSTVSKKIRGSEFLKKLKLTFVSDEIIKAASEKETLEQLAIYCGTFIITEFVDMSKWSNLKELNLGFSGINNKFVNNLGKFCLNLEKLGLSDCCLLTDEALGVLSTLPKLRDLNLCRADKITGKYLKCFTKIEKIHVSGSLIINEDVISLLHNNSVITYFSLIGRITNDIMKDVTEAVEMRTNGIPLKLELINPITNSWIEVTLPQPNDNISIFIG